jgi:V8-like Glu-specific endopeptidase
MTDETNTAGSEAQSTPDSTNLPISPRSGITFIIFPSSTLDRQDDPKVVPNFPLNSVGQLVSEFSDGLPGNGTGILLTAQYVLTCAHNIYIIPEKQRATGGSFALQFLKNLGKGAPKVWSTWTTAFYLPAYETSPDDDTRTTLDYAIIRLNYPVSTENVAQYMQLSTAAIDPNQLPVIAIPGFPSSLTSQYLFQSTGRLDGASDNSVLKYKLSTDVGMSGSPIIRSSDNQIIGLHTTSFPYASTPKTHNCGPKITSAIVQQINTWMTQTD